MSNIVRLLKSNKSKFVIVGLFGISIKYNISLIGISINIFNHEPKKITMDVKKVPSTFLIPKQQFTPEMCNNIIDTNPNNFNLIPSEYITDALCERLLNKSMMFYSLIPKENLTAKIRDKVIKHHEKELKKNYSNIDCIPKELVDDKMFTLAFMKSNGNISHEYINKYDISLSTQKNLNNYCNKNHGHYYSGGYCGVVLNNFKYLKNNPVHF